jgi:hypothetical protein
MVSATGISQDYPVTIQARDDEPLLGHLGDITQKPGESIYWNLFTGKFEASADRYTQLTPDIGTASIAQTGIWIVRSQAAISPSEN